MSYNKSIGDNEKYNEKFERIHLKEKEALLLLGSGCIIHWIIIHKGKNTSKF